ncbi:hypothetical protein SMSP2_01228 [Limihaloglobus sulfuriphilus]|uniref:LamG-like jellyroll fold domain-containing protein n=1 Tax=Limihaloglobus sulfuriphilus TaxID=1851148 RepID=A0A1Q2MDT7_9BACT|nr:LamG domain-containing protein [Limihaloglobus sulfuriphilus]AQQ70866.1 hypothetical protein SMSP2_01228 [Limihaloglobus sulfuriphilus]
MKQIIVLTVVSFFAATSVMAATNWNGAEDTDWFNPNNWATGSVPGESELPQIDYVEGRVMPIFSAPGETHINKGLRIASSGVAGEASVEIAAGKMVCLDYAKLISRYVGQTSKVLVSGGELEVQGVLDIAMTAVGILEITSGYINLEGLTIQMFSPATYPDAQAYVRVHGGEMYVGNLIIQGNYNIDIRNDGTLMLPESELPVIQQMIGEGTLTAYGDGTANSGTGELKVEVLDGTVVVTAIEVKPEQASKPSPAASSALNVLMEANPVELSWTAGVGATSHILYASTDLDELNAAVDETSPAYITTTTNPFYSFTEEVFPEETIYWRVDEVSTAGTETGLVWDFTLLEDTLIDNFDSNVTAWVGSDLNVSAGTAVRMGTQSLQLSYSSAGYAEKTFSKALNFTAGGLESLSVLFHGYADNTSMSNDFYITLTDSSSNSSKVNYGGESFSLDQQNWEAWTAWDVAIADFDNGSIDLTSVEKVAFGIDGGQGDIFIDSFYTYPQRCVADLGPAGDLNNDCVVDLADYNVFAADWLATGYTVTPQAVAGDPVVYYDFEDEGMFAETVTNRSTYGSDPSLYNGTRTLFSTEYSTEGAVGGCIDLLDVAEVGNVSVPASVFDNVTDAVSVSVWVNLHVLEENKHAPVFVGFPSSPANVFNGYVPWVAAPMRVRFVTDNSEVVQEDATYRGTDAYIGVWNHYVFTKDITTGAMRIFMNGDLIAENYTAETMPQISQFMIGASPSFVQRMKGKVDEFRIYDYALSWEEVLTLYGETEPKEVALDSAADLLEDNTVDSQDLQLLTADWLSEILFPEN